MNAKTIALGLALSALLALGCGKPPQVADKEGFDAIMQLATALGAKDMGMLDNSRQSIERLLEEKRFPPDAYEVVEHIVALAREGKWDEARRNLVVFQKGQEPLAN